ncbi:MAG: hypothetical protein AB7O24_14180 [Kofleriaceae bacterium]
MNLKPIAVMWLMVGGAGCATSSDQDAAAQAWSTGNDRFAGGYQVPTDGSLAAAAIFQVARYDWKVSGGDVRLRYHLPQGLVGGEVRVELEGPVVAGDELTLTGDAGTATCTRSQMQISCHEVFDGLPTLPIDVAVVEQLAAVEYDGPPEDRVQVANLFGSDPIGIAVIDLAQPREAD